MTLLEASRIVKTYRTKGNARASVLNGIDFSVDAGESVGLVGESGCGKTTLVRILAQLLRPDSGDLRYAGADLLGAGRADLKKFRSEVQIIFQDPYGSLNPRMTVGQLLAEGLRVHGMDGSGQERRARVAEMLEQVGLDASAAARYPRSFSGGQRQRIAIARSLIIRPRILLCDEPVSSLDVSVQAQIVNLLGELQRQLQLAIVLVSHDLAVVRQVCDRVVVLNDGEIVEQGPRSQIFGAPEHPFTRALLAAVPSPDPSRRRRPTTQRKTSA